MSILWLKLPISQENLFRDSSTGFAIQPVMLIYRSHSVFWCSRYVVYGQFMPAETPYWPKWFVLRPPWLPPSAGYGLYVGLFWNGCDRLRMIVSMRYLVILFVCCRVRVGSARRNQNGKSVECLVDDLHVKESFPFPICFTIFAAEYNADNWPA